MEQESSAHSRTEELAQSALAAGERALSDANSQDNSQAEAVAQRAIDLANKVLARARKLRADDEAQLQSINEALAATQASGASVETQRANSIEARISTLRAELAGLEEALRRLGQSEQLDAAERAQWDRMSDQAAADAWKRGLDMATDGLSRYTLRYLNAGLDDVQKDLQNAATELAGETNPGRRAQLGAAIKLLQAQKKSLQQAERTVENADSQKDRLELAAQASQWAASNPDRLEHAGEALAGAARSALNDPTVQRALKLSEIPGQVARYAETIASTGYDVAAESVSIKQIHSLGQNSNEYLTAVGALQTRIKQTVEQMKMLQAQLQTMPGGTPN